jgi:hypothetical protein
MSFISKIRKIFKKKEVKKTPEQKQQEKLAAILPEKDIPSPLPQKLWVCELCTGTIDPGERWSKFNGKWYHSQCFKALKKGVYNGS